jgi:hypothetical protein
LKTGVFMLHLTRWRVPGAWATPPKNGERPAPGRPSRAGACLTRWAYSLISKGFFTEQAVLAAGRGLMV